MINVKNGLKLLFFVVTSFVTFSGYYTDELTSRMIEYEKTIDFKDYTTVDMINAGNELFIAWDKELNIIYKKILAELDNSKQPKAKEQLIIAQRAWITFRDANANFHAFSSSSDGQGTIVGPIRIGLITEMTEERTKELAEMYDYMIEY